MALLTAVCEFTFLGCPLLTSHIANDFHVHVFGKCSLSIISDNLNKCRVADLGESKRTMITQKQCQRSEA